MKYTFKSTPSMQYRKIEWNAEEQEKNRYRISSRYNFLTIWFAHFRSKVLNKYSNLLSSLLSYLSSLSYLVFEVLAPISLLFQKNPADQNKFRYRIRFFIFERVVSAFKLWKPSCPTNQVYTALAICNSSHSRSLTLRDSTLQLANHLYAIAGGGLRVVAEKRTSTTTNPLQHLQQLLVTLTCYNLNSMYHKCQNLHSQWQ